MVTTSDAAPARRSRANAGAVLHQAVNHGSETRTVEGIPARAYSAAKTVADCFKFRNKVGLDVALEALRDFRRTHRGRIDDLYHAAKARRVERVMRPYLEATS